MLRIYVKKEERSEIDHLKKPQEEQNKPKARQWKEIKTRTECSKIENRKITEKNQ